MLYTPIAGGTQAAHVSDGTSTMTNRPAILIEKLYKSYGKVRALDGLDLTVAEGSVLAVLGPNGAGKTTMVRCLTTLSRPDSGRVQVAGYDVVRQADVVRACIGLTGQFAAVDERLTGFENLEMFGLLIILVPLSIWMYGHQTAQ